MTTYQTSQVHPIVHIVWSRDFFVFLLSFVIGVTIMLTHAARGVPYSDFENLRELVPLYFQTFAIVEAVLISSLAIFIGSGAIGRLMERVREKDEGLHQRMIRVIVFPARIGLIAVVVALVLAAVPFEGLAFILLFSLLTALLLYLVAALWLMIDGLRNAIEASAAI